MSVAVRVWTGPWAIADPQGGGIHIAPVLGNDKGIRAEYYSQEDRWFGRVVAILSAVYVSAEFLTRSSFYGVLPTWVGTSMRLTIRWDRYAFVTLWAYVVYRAIRHEERAAWIALPAILLIAIAQFGAEWGAGHLVSVWHRCIAIELRQLFFYVCALWDVAATLRTRRMKYQQAARSCSGAGDQCRHQGRQDRCDRHVVEYAEPGHHDVGTCSRRRKLKTFYWASGGSSPASRPETRSRSPAASQAWFRRESVSGRRTPDSWSCDKAW